MHYIVTNKRWTEGQRSSNFFSVYAKHGLHFNKYMQKTHLFKAIFLFKHPCQTHVFQFSAIYQLTFMNKPLASISFHSRLGMGATCLQIHSFTMECTELDWGWDLLQRNRGRPSTQHSEPEGKPMGHRKNTTDSLGGRIFKALDRGVRYWSRRKLPMVGWQEKPTCKLHKVSDIVQTRWSTYQELTAVSINRF